MTRIGSADGGSADKAVAPTAGKSPGPLHDDRQQAAPRLIEDYAIVGDRKTAALIHKSGSLDWLCLPRFDSPAAFASLLGGPENGYWSIAPTDPEATTNRRYDDGSIILRTAFRTPQGAVELIDFMPEGSDRSHVVRILRGVEGEVEMRCKIAARFDYGLTVPWVTEVDDRTYSFIAGANRLVVRTPVRLSLDHGDPEGNFVVARGQSFAFVLSHGSSHLSPPDAIDVDDALRTSQEFWSEWSGRCEYRDTEAELVKRSLITLKALSYMPTGGIVAAVTTSLPEFIGGERNWDYRYCWVRDATFTLIAFLNAGYTEEAAQWRDWLLRAIAGNPSQIQIMYGVAGERLLQEWTVPWLKGFENSAPVRIGNAASTQRQLDIFGELTDAMAIAADHGLQRLEHGLDMRRLMLAHLEKIWAEPDEGIWEIRGEPRHFTHSKVMAWVAFDRAVRGSRQEPDLERRAHYETVANKIRQDVCDKAVDPDRNCFVQSYGSRHMDASLLLLPIVGFLSPDDPRIRNTVAQIEKHLMWDGFVLRYETETNIDGLPPGEGVFIACSFWLVDNYVAQGRLAEAEALFGKLADIANDVGLIAEEYDPVNKRILGNFPQAFSHVALVNSAFSILRARQTGGKIVHRRGPV